MKSNLPKKYALASSTWDSSEKDAMQRVIASGKFTMGDEVRRFEREFAEFNGSTYSVMFNSGSSANLALVAASLYRNPCLIRPGSSIIVPAVSWSTTYFPVNQLGFKLSFVDIDPDTLNIDVNLIERSITSDTAAIFGVNLLGNPADWYKIKEIADSKNLVLLEDNCESMGATLGGKNTGTFGVGGTFSTFFSHHISTMEGGLVVTDDLNLYETLLSLRAHGWTRDLSPKNSVHTKTGNDWDDLFRFVLPGYNLRPLELEGALGQSQLRKLPDFIDQRRKNAQKLISLSNQLEFMRFQKEFGDSSWFGFSIVLEGPLVGKRKQLVKSLSDFGIETRPIVTGNFTRNPVMKHLNFEEIPSLPIADEIHENGFFVGNHHFDLGCEIDLLVELLVDFEEKHVK